jgi:type IV pilus assembly protein PilQ
MRRTAILSFTTLWLMLGLVSTALGAEKPGSSPASLKAVSITSPTSPHEVILRIDGDYSYHTTRATGDTVLVDLRGVKVAGVAKDGKLGGGIVTDYHLLQYMDSSGQPVVRVQLNLKQPESLRAYREAGGLRLAFGAASEPATGTPPVAPAAPPQATLAPATTRPSAGGSLQVSGVSITTGPGGETYVDIVTTGPARYKVLQLTNPARLVVDLEGARNAAQKSYAAQSAFLKGVRVGQFREENPSVVRVVADLAGDPAFDIHARGGGVRMELRSRSSRTVSSVAPAVDATRVESKPAAKPVETIALPKPEEILSVKTEPAPAPAVVAKAEETTAPPPVAEEKPAPAPIEFQNTLPAPASAPDAVAARKPEPAPAYSEEAIQAARAALTLANTPGLIAATPQDQPAGPAQEQPKYTGEPISLNLKDVDVKDFFRLIHEISGLNIIVDPNVTGNVTLVLDAVPWDQALDIVLKNNRLGKTLEGNVLRIARVETLTAEQEAAAKLAAAREEALPLVTVFRPVNYAKASTISTMLKSWVGGGALSKRGNILVDDRTNTLIISDIQTQIPIIQSIIDKLDKKAKQVQIEARIVRASADFSRTLAAALNVGLKNTSGRTLGGAATGSNSSAGTEVPPGDILLTPAKASGFGAVAITNAGANYFINAAIAAAENKAQAKTISKPTIVTQNNVPGTVTQGTQIPIQTSINNTISIQYVNAALTLRVTPQVTEDGNIFLDINVTNAAPGLVLTSAGPSIDTQNATTQVLVPDGGTVVFGGVTVTRRQKSATQVPVLGSIPILGHLFKSSLVSDSDAELLFFVSPKILPG